jgi:transcriptional regulator with XRE-family HTH domain
MVILSKFVERLEEFLILGNLTPKELSENIGVTHATLLTLKRGKSLPSGKTFFALVEYFNCSADYLLGIADDYPDDKTYPPATEDFAAHFRLLLTETGTSQYELTQNAKISGNLLYKWLHGQTLPTAVNLCKLAQYMGITVDHLIGRE